MIVVDKQILVIQMQVTRSNHWLFTGHSGGHRNSRLRICLATKRTRVQSFIKAGHTSAFASGASEIAWGLKIPQETEQLNPGTAKTEAAYSRAPMPRWNVLCDAMKIPWSTTKTHWSQINEQIFFKNILILLPLDIIIRSETVRSYACSIRSIWGNSVLFSMYYLHSHQPFTRVPVYLYCAALQRSTPCPLLCNSSPPPLMSSWIGTKWLAPPSWFGSKRTQKLSILKSLT